MGKTKGEMKVSAVSIKIGLHAKINQTKWKKKEQPDKSNLYTKIKLRKTMRNLLKKKKKRISKLWIILLNVQCGESFKCCVGFPW